MAMGTTGASSLLQRQDEEGRTSASSLQPQAEMPLPQPMAGRGPTPGDFSIVKKAEKASGGYGLSSTRQIGRNTGMSARTVADNALLGGVGAFKEDPNNLGSIIQDPNDPRRRPTSGGSTGLSPQSPDFINA